MISKGKVMSPILTFTILKEFLKPFRINRVQGERTRTREIDMELGNYLDWLGNQKGMIARQGKQMIYAIKFGIK